MKPKKQKFTFFIILLNFVLVSFSLQAQYFVNGQDPASMRWQQIKNGQFKIIFPENYDRVAQYYTNLLQLASPFVSQPYNPKLRSISILLHNQTTTSNAMVPIAPQRMEFFEMPDQKTYPQIWQQQLVLHEYRHVAQENKMRQGLTKGLYYITGESGLAFVFGAFVPFWFIEGDAVISETMFSNSGRGRSPDFLYPLKAQVLDKKIYKYDKAVFGSYKNFVPDHYQLGYQLVAHANLNYGIEMWDKTLNLVARRFYYLMPFSVGMKKGTGTGKFSYYKKTMNLLAEKWKAEDGKSKHDSVEIISLPQKFYTDYLFPNSLNGGSIIVQKTGLNDISSFVLVDKNGIEKKLFTPGYDFEESLSVADSLICWNEKAFDPRWEMRNYSVIKIHDLKTGKTRQISSKSRYFAPALSPDGSKVVTVFVSEKSEYFLYILDANSGEILNKIHTPDNLFFMTPHWSEDGKNIVSIVLGDKGKSLIKLNAEKLDYVYLLPFSFTEIKWPVMQGKWVVLTGAYEGKDNLYAIDTETGWMKKVLETRFGATNVSFAPNGQKLNFSYYTADGYRLAQTDWKPDEFESFDYTKKHFTFLADKLVSPGNFNLNESYVPDSVYVKKKYSKAANLFYIHSWAPLSVDVDNYTANPGLTLLSQNMLSTTIASASYLYDINESTSTVKFAMEYTGWYPVVSLAVEYGGRRVFHENDGQTDEINWKETNLTLDFSLPLNFTSSKYIKGIRPAVGVSQKFLRMEPGSKYEFTEGRFTVPVYQLYAYNLLKKSLKDIYPKWGQAINLVYRHSVFSDSVNHQTALSGILFFPGLIRHQGIRVYGGYQNSVEDSYSFSNLVSFPRGYTNLNYPEYFSIKNDYAFPIAYPDWDVPGLMYLKRIFAHGFYDYMKGYNDGSWQKLSSAGAELYTDWHFLSTILQVTLGARATYRFYYENMQFEFLFGITY